MSSLKLVVNNDSTKFGKFRYTSDLHFNHLPIAQKRGFTFTDEMNQHIVDVINDTVEPEDTLVHLGDLCMYNKGNADAVRYYLKQIKCDVYCIQGNHDSGKFLDKLRNEFLIRAWRTNKCVDDTAFGHLMTVACYHHPVIDYHSERKPVMCLHGHSHGQCLRDPFDLQDVGWDVFGKPVTLEEILQYKFSNQPIDRQFMDPYEMYMTWLSGPTVY